MLFAMTAHGFRGMASTLLNESGLWSPDAIELQLAHNVVIFCLDITVFGGKINLKAQEVICALQRTEEE